MTEFERISGIMYTLLAHQPIIDVPYETINDIAVALVKEGYGDVKQAKIDVLNAVKKRIYDISPYNPLVLKDDVKRFIDKLIEEIENGKDIS